MPKLNYLIIPASLALLTACGGGGGGDGSGLVYGEDIVINPSDGVGSGAISTAEFTNIGDAFDALSDSIGDGTYAAPVTRPTGTIMMTGYIGVNEPGDEDFVTVGNLSISADFDMSDIDGTAGDFRRFDVTSGTPVEDGDLTGTLTITGNNTGDGFAADLTGDLVDGMDTLNITATMGGNLFDVEGTPTYVGGVDGTFSVNGDMSANTIEGDFVAF